MWGKRSRPQAPARADPALHALINLRPQAERQLYDDDAVHDLLRRKPSAAGATYALKIDGRGTIDRYPLFRLAALGASLKTMKLCHKCNPEAIAHVPTDNRSTVLHVACANGADATVIRYLYKKYPDAIKGKSKHGFTPLHNACAHGKASGEVVRFIAEAHPEALEMKNILGETPHMAAINGGVGEEVIAALSSVGDEAGARDNTRIGEGLHRWHRKLRTRQSINGTAETVESDTI